MYHAKSRIIWVEWSFCCACISVGQNRSPTFHQFVHLFVRLSTSTLSRSRVHYLPTIGATMILHVMPPKTKGMLLAMTFATFMHPSTSTLAATLEMIFHQIAHNHWTVKYRSLTYIIFYKVKLCVTLINNLKYVIHPSNCGLTDIRQNHWTMKYRSLTQIYFKIDQLKQCIVEWYTTFGQLQVDIYHHDLVIWSTLQLTSNSDLFPYKLGSLLKLICK